MSNEPVRLALRQVLPMMADRDGVETARDLAAAIAEGRFRIMPPDDAGWYDVEVQDVAGDWVPIFGLRGEDLGLP